MRLKDHVRSVNDLSALFSGLDDLIDRFRAAEGDEQRLLAQQIANRWDAIADECEQSRATRLLFSGWSVEEMRALAAQWRTGQEPQ